MFINFKRGEKKLHTNNTSRSNTSQTLNKWLDFRLQLFFEGIITGLLAGGAVISYRILLDKSENLRNAVYLILKNGEWSLTLLWFCFLIAIGVLLGYLVKKEPDISGSGVSQVKGILHGYLKVNWFRILYSKFFGGVLAIFGGLSLGLAGPSVQLGATMGQGFSRFLGRLRIEEKFLITSGASAGLAAAFNAPLAGVIFSLEEMHKNFSHHVLTSAMAASLTADFLSQSFFGQEPLFSFPTLSTFPLRNYPYLIILGLIIGIFGIVFNIILIKSLNIYQKIPLPVHLRPVLPLIIAGLLGFLMPEVLGGGHHIVNLLSTTNLPLLFLLTLLILKFIFTMVSYGSGVPGGIFLPLLVIGALAGNIYGFLVCKYFNLEPQFINNFIILAMAAYFTAIVKAPITGSILITELTGSFSHLLAMITVSMSAYIISELMNSKPIYDVLLNRILKNKNKSLSDENKEKIIIEVPVCLGSNLENKCIKDIQWPPSCLLVGIERGGQEIIPKGDTKIFAGDYLIVLTDETEEVSTRKKLQTLASEKTIY